MSTTDRNGAAPRWAGVTLIILLLVAAPSAIWAAEGPTASVPGPFPGYKVGLGDRVQISVWGEPSLTTDTVVMPDGTISMPMIGSLLVVGKTASELMADVREAYKRYLREPRVSLNCLPRNPPRIYCEGAVGKPGPVDYDPRLRLLDYVALAGGPAAGADLSRVMITSLKGSEVTKTTVDMSPGKAAQGPASSLELKPGDTLWIGKALPVSVVGEVVRPGSFDYQQGLRLSDYLGMAGGPTDHAAVQKVVLKSAQGIAATTRTIDCTHTLSKPETAGTNPVLSPGDVVTVPAKLVGGTLGLSDVLRGVVDLLLIWRRW